MALNNSQYDTIMRAYEQRQLRSQDNLRRHYEEVYARIPKLRDLEQSLSSLSVSQARKLLTGDDSALPVLRQQIQDLCAQKQQLLLSHGYAPDFLEPEYECPDCRDTGYIGNEKCHCFKKAVIELLYAQSNLQETLKKENFSTFSLDYYSDNYMDEKTGRSARAIIKSALQTSLDFIDTFDKEFHNLFFYGNTGVGKTFLSHCIAKELMDRSFSVIYFTAFELFDVFAKSRFEKDITAEEMDEHIFDCDLLIIDDLGTELANSFTTSQLFLCLNERILRQKSTIISTNLSLEALVEQYSERTFSRITSNYTMLKLVGDDIRIKKKLMKREG